MGWASASDLFGDVAQALIDAECDTTITRNVLSKLIGTLSAEDWDTQNEALEDFAAYPAVVLAFADHGYYPGYCRSEYTRVAPVSGRGTTFTCRLEQGHTSLHTDQGVTWMTYDANG